MYDGKLIPTKHHLKMSTILLYYDSYILPENQFYFDLFFVLALLNYQIAIEILSTNLFATNGTITFKKSNILS